jgi:Tfp pilus assembly protein PilF
MRIPTRSPSALAALLLAPALVAQEVMPQRPKLPTDADTNDARAYFAYGQLGSTPWGATVDAYHWAWRLDPSETDYLYVWHNALFSRQSLQWRTRYNRGDRRVAESKEAKLIDSLWVELLRRDPFPYIEGPCLLLPGIEQERDPAVAGLVFSWMHCPQRAVEKLGQALEKDPSDARMRFTRAQNLFYSRQFTAAGQEIQVLLDSLRARDEKSLGPTYFTKDLFEHMLAVSLLRARDTARAHAALTRALTENLGYYPAHVSLAKIAMDRRDVATALREAEQAAALQENDGVLRYDYGVLLFRSGKIPEAEAQFKKAVELEPYWADARRQLAVTLDRQDKRDEAIAAYEAFLARAPKRENIRIKEVQDRIAALEAPGSP